MSLTDPSVRKKESSVRKPQVYWITLTLLNPPMISLPPLPLSKAHRLEAFTSAFEDVQEEECVILGKMLWIFWLSGIFNFSITSLQSKLKYKRLNLGTSMWPTQEKIGCWRTELENNFASEKKKMYLWEQMLAWEKIACLVQQREKNKQPSSHWQLLQIKIKLVQGRGSSLWPSLGKRKRKFQHRSWFRDGTLLRKGLKLKGSQK